MGASKEEIAAIEARRGQVAALSLRKVSADRIAVQLKFDRATIFRDLVVLKGRWACELSDLGNIRLLEFAELREMEREAASHPADIGWAALRLRYKERLAKMLGLDAMATSQSGFGAAPGTVVAVAPGEIDWDNVPDHLAERFLALNAELKALQPASGGLVVEAEFVEVTEDEPAEQSG